ncbi:hypothetical protein AB6A40_006437 [Gnathostoma spinigerum]|uniref:Uncharacterized protein n=1 Tax=Gnathostoma spinigerum TaxID=75299 RepID=A0ABD6EIK7_9BILA
MSKKGSELPVQLNDSDISQHSVRKRASPNNINTRKDLTVCATTLIAAVGSSSSKVRRISHPPTDQCLHVLFSLIRYGRSAFLRVSSLTFRRSN